MNSIKTLSRRELLKQSVAAGSVFVVGTGFVASASGAWAVESAHLAPSTMATLIQMARDIYPHDRIGNEFYAVAVKGYDTPDSKDEIEQGIAEVNRAAVAAGYKDYLNAGWELDRVEILRSIEGTAFFQKIRGGLVTGLYNQKEVWPVFGYEGESFSKGGYIDRGFNDINWV